MHVDQLTLCVAAVYGGKTKKVQWEREYFTPAHLNVMDSRHCEEGEMAEKQSKRKRAEEYKQRRKLHDQARPKAFSAGEMSEI